MPWRIFGKAKNKADGASKKAASRENLTSSKKGSTEPTTSSRESKSGATLLVRRETQRHPLLQSTTPKLSVRAPSHDRASESSGNDDGDNIALADGPNHSPLQTGKADPIILELERLASGMATNKNPEMLSYLSAQVLREHFAKGVLAAEGALQKDRSAFINDPALMFPKELRAEFRRAAPFHDSKLPLGTHAMRWLANLNDCVRAQQRVEEIKSLIDNKKPATLQETDLTKLSTKKLQIKLNEAKDLLAFTLKTGKFSQEFVKTKTPEMMAQAFSYLQAWRVFESDTNQQPKIPSEPPKGPSGGLAFDYSESDEIVDSTELSTVESVDERKPPNVAEMKPRKPEVAAESFDEIHEGAIKKRKSKAQSRAEIDREIAKSIPEAVRSPSGLSFPDLRKLANGSKPDKKKWNVLIKRGIDISFYAQGLLACRKEMRQILGAKGADYVSKSLPRFCKDHFEASGIMSPREWLDKIIQLKDLSDGVASGEVAQHWYDTALINEADGIDRAVAAFTMEQLQQAHSYLVAWETVIAGGIEQLDGSDTKLTAKT